MNLPLGFLYSATYAGIRQAEKDDLALIVSGLPANAAAVFTQNRVQAAPVQAVPPLICSVSKGLAGAILVNAGNANCATRTGDAVALATCQSRGQAAAAAGGAGAAGFHRRHRRGAGPAARSPTPLPRLVAGLSPTASTTRRAPS